MKINDTTGYAGREWGEGSRGTSQEAYCGSRGREEGQWVETASTYPWNPWEDVDWEMGWDCTNSNHWWEYFYIFGFK